MSTLSEQYAKNMRAGNLGICFEIERRAGLAGFPPELVSVGLLALENGGDPYAAIKSHMAPADTQTADMFQAEGGKP